MNIVKRMAAALCLSVTLPVAADMNEDLHQFFGKLGFESNTSAPQVWQGQAAGYASGGSFYSRTAVRQMQMASMALPKINSGCGGIDAYLGSFSHINSEQIQRFARQIIGNASGYAFDLALQVALPEMKNAKDFMQKLATDVNSSNLSSCQAAQGIVGGLAPHFAVSQQKICQDISGENNLFSDWAASRQGCTVGGGYNSVTAKASEAQKDQVLNNKNLMWDSLGKNRLFDGNLQLKEFAMSLTGTLIFDDQGRVKVLMPLTTSQDIIRAMMQGGQASIYTCDTQKACLNPTMGKVTIAKDHALSGQVTKLLTHIQNKAVSDSPLDEQERGLIQSTSIPILRYLVDPQSLGVANSLIFQLADYIGYDILVQYLRELIQQSAAMLSNRQYPKAALEQLRNGLTQASHNLAQLQTQVQIQQDALLVVDRQMSYMRQQVSSRLLERYQNNYRFTGGQ